MTWHHMDISNLILFATEQAAEHVGESAGFIGTLGLNWKLFLAQFLNFGIVVFILWKWVFKPVGGALEARRKRIEESVLKAQAIEDRMRSAEKEYEERLRQAQIESNRILNLAQAQAEASKLEIAGAARTEAERILSDAKLVIAADREKMFRELREEVANLTVMAVQKIIRIKLDEHKDKELLNEIFKTIR